MSRAKARLGAALLGLVFAVVLLEVVLRLVGMAHVQATRQVGQAQGGGQRTVLCLGDSFTEGLGAEDQESYPARLEPLLNGQGVARTVVLNRGRAGENSAQVLARLPGLLDRERPDLVILLAGASNYWNLWGHGLSFAPGRHSAAKDLLFRLRVFKLAVLLFHHLSGQRPDPVQDFHGFRQKVLGTETVCSSYSAWFYPVPVPGRSAGGAHSRQHGALLGEITARIAASPGEGHLYCAKALVQTRMGASSAAVATLRRGLAADPKNSHLHYLLGTLHAGVIADMNRGGPGQRRALDAARRWHQKGMAVDPGNGDNYHGMGEIYALQTARGEDMDPAHNEKMFKQALSWFARGIEADLDRAPSGRARVSFLKKYLEGAADEYAWIRSDVAAMIKIIQAHKVPVLLHSYPNNSRNKPHILRALRNTNRAMKDLARIHGLPLVDHHRRFQELGVAGTTEGSLFSADLEHPNKEGYRVMAQGLARRIVELGLLQE